MDGGSYEPNTDPLEKQDEEYLSSLSYLRNLPPQIPNDPPKQGPIYCYCDVNQCLGMHEQETLLCCCRPENIDEMNRQHDYLKTLPDYFNSLSYLKNAPLLSDEDKDLILRVSHNETRPLKPETLKKYYEELEKDGL